MWLSGARIALGCAGAILASACITSPPSGSREGCSGEDRASAEALSLAAQIAGPPLLPPPLRATRIG